MTLTYNPLKKIHSSKPTLTQLDRTRPQSHKHILIYLQTQTAVPG